MVCGVFAVFCGSFESLLSSSPEIPHGFASPPSSLPVFFLFIFYFFVFSSNEAKLSGWERGEFEPARQGPFMAVYALPSWQCGPLTAKSDGLIGSPARCQLVADG